MTSYGKAPQATFLTGHRSGMIRAIVSSRDAATVLTRADDGQVFAWDARTRRPLWAQTCDDPRFCSHGFDHLEALDDVHAILGSSNRLRIIRMADGATVQEHLTINVDIHVVLPEGRLLVSHPEAPSGTLDIIDAWSLRAYARIGTHGRRYAARKGPGGLALLIPEQPDAGPMEAWHGAGQAIGTLAWRSEAEGIHDACCTQDGIAALCPSSVAMIDPANGATTSTMPFQPQARGEAPGQLCWRDAQLVLVRHGHCLPLVSSRIPMRAIGSTSDRLPCDIRHRDHAEMVPADGLTRCFDADSWTDAGIRSWPAALCALDDGIVGMVTSDGALVRWDFASRRLLSRERIATLAEAAQGVQSPTASAWSARIAADCDAEQGTMIAADRKGVLTVHDIRTGTRLAHMDTGIQEIGLVVARAGSTHCLIASGTAYSHPRRLAAVDIASGTTLWQRDVDHLGSCCWDPPRPIIIAACHSHLQRLSASDGSDIGAPSSRPSSADVVS